MHQPVKACLGKPCILSLLLLVWGALLPAYACSPEVDKAVARLQKSARAKISAEDWLAQVVNESSYFYSVTASGDVTGEDSEEKLRAAFFPNKQSLIYLKQYMANVRIRQDAGNEKSAPRKFLFNSKEINYTYTYSYIYPYSISRDDSSKSACQFGVQFFMTQHIKEDDNVTESWFLYIFDIVDGEMKIIRINAAG